MPINYDKLINWKIPDVEHHVTPRDAMLFALGVGLGSDPCDIDQLKFVYEKHLQALPMMAIVFGYPGPWFADPDTGITRSQTLHGEQGFTVHKPLPLEGTLVARTQVTAVIDKGKDKGALVLTGCTVFNKNTDEVICTTTSTSFCRADGGFDGPAGAIRPPHRIPDTPPVTVCDLPTLPQAALIYRLSGDYNSLHADPAYARKAGFKMPILHGRCTFSVAGHALLKSCCDYEPTRLKSMEARFSAPVYPGETIRTEMWQADNIVSFRSTVPARGVTVLNNGRAEIEK